MTDRDDHRLVDLLYDEVPPEEAGALREALRHDDETARDLASFEATLGMIRSVPEDEPPDFLNAKIMAAAREAAETQSSGWAKWRRRLMAPGFGLAVGGVTASLAALTVIPLAMFSSARPASEPT
ncbi:MAG: hypothetical protein AAFN74_22755, partial [Myxococcota bacterium]